MLAHLSPEMKLACLLCRPSLSERARALALEQIAAGLDWGAFFRYVEDDGIFPLISRHVETALAGHVPLEARGWLLAHTAKLRERSEAFARELAGLLADLEAAGIRAVPFKGPVLIEQLWGDSRLRMCFDLDVIVRPEDLRRAAETLRRRGYALDDKTLRAAAAAGVDSITLERTEGLPCLVTLELEAGPPGWFPRRPDVEGIWGRLERREFSGAPVWALPDDWNLVLLAMHAYHHLFRSLRWVGGFYGLLEARREAWPEAMNLAEELGIRREVVLAREVCEAILGEEAVGGETLKPPVGRLADMPFQPEISHWEHIRLHLTLLPNRKRIRYLLSGLFRPTFYDAAWRPLPESKVWLYYLLRPVRLVSKLIGPTAP